ncbi:Gfo/Idh/MocA family protein [Halanaerobaculum tunisiense]
MATRNQDRLNHFANKYNVQQTVQSIEELIKIDVKAVFVHVATVAHVEIVKKLLMNDIHVYLDKPISNHYQESKRIVELAEERNLKLMIGFNRRRVPLYQRLREVDGERIITLQKNRFADPGKVRSKIYDDFIHIVDTLRFLAGENITDFTVDAVVKNNLLHQIMIKLDGPTSTAIGIMNRDSGKNEEVAEVIGAKQKLIVKDLVELIEYQNEEEKISKGDSWDPVLYKRGFMQIVDEFLEVVRRDKDTTQATRDALKSHKLCEEIIQEIRD